MILAYSTNAYTRFSLPEALNRIRALGFNGVEIMGDRPHLYPPDFTESELVGLRGTIQGLGLEVTNINSFTLFAVGDTYLPSWIEEEPSLRRIRIRHTLDCLKVARILGCPNISVPPGGPLRGMSRKQALHLFHAGMDEVIPVAEQLGVRVLVEPEPGLLLESSKDFKEFICSVSSKAVGLNFDVGHFFCVGEDPGEALEELFSWVSHVHLEDIGPDRRHIHMIPGEGSVDLRGFVRKAARLGYRGSMSLELYTYPHMPDEAGKRGLDWLRPVLEEVGWLQ